MADNPQLDFTVSITDFGPAVPGALANGKTLVVESMSDDTYDYIELNEPGPGENRSDWLIQEAFIRGCFFGNRSSTSGTAIRVEDRITRRERKTQEQEKLEQQNKVRESKMVVVTNAYLLRDCHLVTVKLI